MADAMGIRPNLGPIFTYAVTDHPDERVVPRDPELMMALATLSRGNVQLGDNPENTNIDLVSTCCNINGEIIGPEKSIGPLSVGIALHFDWIASYFWAFQAQRHSVYRVQFIS